MKKLVVIGCAALAVISAKAASIDWKYQINGDAGGAADQFTGYTVYLVDKAYYDSLGGEVTKDSITGTGNYVNSATLSQTGKSGKGASTKYVFSATKTETSDSLVQGTTYDYYLVLVNGDDYMATAYSYTARDSTGTPDAASFTSQVAASAVSSGMTAFYTGGGTDPLPEPTSGLLLLVGGAVLALRRKQK